MKKLKKNFYGFVVFLMIFGTISLFFFIKWYWVVLVSNLMFSIYGYIYWLQVPKNPMGLFRAIVLPLLFNFLGLLFFIFINAYKNSFKDETPADLLVRNKMDQMVADKTINEENEVEINWIYGIDKAIDYKEKKFEKNLVFYKYEQEEGCCVVYKGVNNFDEGKDFIDKIISQNGGQNNFKRQGDQDKYKYIHLGDLFNISYLESYEIVEIEKVEQFVSVRKESKYGINENDINIRSLVNGLDKIIYNDGEGSANGRLCVQYNNDDSYFVYAYFDKLDESLTLFKKIVTNYDKNHQVFHKSNKILDEIINSEGITHNSDLFELMLIRENVKYKFYITPPGGFYSNWSFE